ncbi:hypothetical protein GTA08_BOTSDO10494 [Neofusicoccum parvum]|nr:hypothetical protein GTA08_BOTSDO10494 [Neofusicoccum parvum]
MASPIKNVVIIGAGGNLGRTVLKEFLNSSFDVTILSRAESKTVFPDGTKVVKTDYSPESLRSAFAGKDAIVSIVSAEGHEGQKTVIDAAISAGVKRFIPSDFGSDTSKAEVLDAVPFLIEKRKIVDYLRTKEDNITWTALVNSAFFDWTLKFGILGPDLEKRQATIWDDGDVRFTATNLNTIGKALVAILSGGSYEKTKNQYIRIASHVQSQNDILESLRRITGEEWPVTARQDLGAHIKSTQEKVAQGHTEASEGLLLGILFGKKNLAIYGPLRNEELGLPREKLDDSVRAVLEGRQP